MFYVLFYCRFYRPKSDFIANVSVKQVKFSDATLPDKKIENGVLEKLENMITDKFYKEQESLKESITVLEKKLKRKQNENQNLIDNIEKLTKAELDRVSEIYDLKEALDVRNKDYQKISDELAVKTKEQIENVKVKDLEAELEDLRKVLKLTTDELWMLKEKYRVESTKTKRKYDKDLEEQKVVSNQVESLNQTVKEQMAEIEHLNKVITKGDNIIKTKDNELEKLKEVLANDQKKLSIQDRLQYQNFK